MSRANARDGATAERAICVLLARSRVHDLPPVLPVAVAHEHGDGPTERLAGAHAGEQFHGVALDLHASPAAVALLATRQVGVHVRGEQGKPGGHSLEDGDERRAV